MIQFHHDNSLTASITFLTFIILCSILSLSLNHVVFLYNKQKQSTAAFLFTILSSIDFIYCLTLPIILFTHINTPHEPNTKCFGVSEKEYWNCIYPSTIGQIVSTSVMLCVYSAEVSTAGLLAINRYIQLTYPLILISKRCVTCCIAVVFAVILCLQLSALISPIHRSVYSPMLMQVVNANPYNLGFSWQSQYISTLITNLGAITVQLGALVSAVFTVTSLLRNHSGPGLGNNRLSQQRKRGSLKILLTNIPSFLVLLRIITEPPIWSVARKHDNSGLYSELQGWIIFFLHRILPLLASTWNPIIFLSLTPNSRRRGKIIHHSTGFNHDNHDYPRQSSIVPVTSSDVILSSCALEVGNIEVHSSNRLMTTVL